MPNRTEEELAVLIEQEWVEREVIDYRDKMERICSKCQSPIERILYRALYLEKPGGEFCFFGGSTPQDYDSLWRSGTDWGTDQSIGGAYVQVDFGNYRADFYMEAFELNTKKRWFTAVIECDGHDFHERTKDQVRRDKKRDRWFQTRGIQTIRFAGSEIWKDPLKYAEEAWEVYYAASRRHFFNRD